MRTELTRERLAALMSELARTAPRRGHYRVYLTGGGTAVWMGWRESSIDVDLSTDDEAVFRHIQSIKDRLNVNIEFARPDDFVPALERSDDRHILIQTAGSISFFHFDPYTQLLSKIVRGFRRDLDDAHQFLRSGLVDPREFQRLVKAVPESIYAKYPHLSRLGIETAVGGFLAQYTKEEHWGSATRPAPRTDS